jgi:hypothetical protein
MTALVKTAVGTIVMFALAILVTLMVGRFVFTQFGAVTMVVIYSLAAALFLTFYGGYVAGTIAAALSPRHAEIIAVSASAFLAVVIFGVATAMSLEREWLLWLLPWMLVVAAWRAWRVNAKGMSA